MLDGQQSRGVVHGAVAVVVIADRAIEQMVAKNAIERLTLGARGARRCCENGHPICGGCGACADQIATDFNHTGVAGFDRAKLRMVADLWNLLAGTVDDVYQSLARRKLMHLVVDGDRFGDGQMNLAHEKCRSPGSR